MDLIINFLGTLVEWIIGIALVALMLYIFLNSNKSNISDDDIDKIIKNGK